MTSEKITVYVSEAGIGKMRTSMFRDHIKLLGGLTVDAFNMNVTHVVVDEKMDCAKLCRSLKLLDCSSLQNIAVITSKWLTMCINDNKFLKIDNYKISCNHVVHKDIDLEDLIPSTSGVLSCMKNDFRIKNPEISKAKKPKYVGSLMKDDDSSYESDVNEDIIGDKKIKESSDDYFFPMKRKWICQFSSKSMKMNYNKHITDKLQELMEAYHNINDKWRVLGYQKAIVALKKHPYEITSYEEAKSISGVGDRLAEKIVELIESGKLRKLDELTSQEQTHALKLFTNVWGAGPNAARNWVMQGFRTLDDLWTKAKLSKHQKVGVLLYDDLIERMSRNEVEKITDIVKENALLLQPGLTVETCGSFRRGKSDCGDVDILISHPDGKSHHGLFLQLLDKLHDINFLTHDLVISSEGRQQKYLGVCKLPAENSKHRRLDIIVVPQLEYAAALVYFTGSGIFNRSMRHLASKMKMSLNEHGLYADVARIDGEKVDRGQAIITLTEESIFKILNVPYRPPNERDF